MLTLAVEDCGATSHNHRRARERLYGRESMNVAQLCDLHRGAVLRDWYYTYYSNAVQRVLQMQLVFSSQVLFQTPSMGAGTPDTTRSCKLKTSTLCSSVLRRDYVAVRFTLERISGTTAVEPKHAACVRGPLQ